jgi:hypothetical protein
LHQYDQKLQAVEATAVVTLGAPLNHDPTARMQLMTASTATFAACQRIIVEEDIHHDLTIFCTNLHII